MQKGGLQVEILLQATENRADRTRLGVAAALACALAVLTAVAWPGAAESAPARVVVLGKTTSPPPPSCPGKVVNNVEILPCRVEGHVTGYQAKIEGEARPYEAPFDGKIVAWSITLAKPSRKETKTTTDEVGFFDEFLGRPSQARIGVLRPVEDSSPPQYTLVRQSPLEVLNPYFGSTPIFALEHPLTVLRGQVVALTIPTWAPALAVGGGSDTAWRASRLPDKCGETPEQARVELPEGHPQQRPKSKKVYACYYRGSRLLYTATLVKKPRQ